MSAAVSPRTKGRPRTFDRDSVLDALVELFWEKGYEATSMSDIVESSGLNKSSLYNAFGSKDLLFHEALNRYVDYRAAMLTSLLSDGTAGLADVHALFDVMWTEMESTAEHRGCLAVNTSTELGLRDEHVVNVGQRYRTSMRCALLDALDRAAEHGEIETDMVETYANIMVSIILGLAVLVRSGAGHDEVRGQLDAARIMLDSWKLTS